MSLSSCHRRQVGQALMHDAQRSADLANQPNLKEVALSLIKHQWVRQQQATLLGFGDVMRPLALTGACAGLRLLPSITGNQTGSARHKCRQSCLVWGKSATATLVVAVATSVQGTQASVSSRHQNMYCTHERGIMLQSLHPLRDTSPASYCTHLNSRQSVL